MLNYGVIHPQLVSALARSGHGTQILLADGYYPHNTGAPQAAERVYLNLRPGVLDADTILAALLDAVPIEAVGSMLTAEGEDSPAVQGYLRALPEGIAVVRHERYAFYEAARSPDVAVVICSADVRQYANLLLTIGVSVRQPHGEPA
ncbi:RbsD/FucU family protein [Micrococcales bacterium 31B]|nr:RbsD/FucU family protein [Micrococcales bacterium 31B]